MDTIVARLFRHSDLAGIIAVVMVVVMMIIPLPSELISVMVTLNIATALSIIAATMYVRRALEFASFPSLLLLTTLFRLAINVSVTRLVLVHGEAGSVIHAFGSFVVGGNLVVGQQPFFSGLFLHRFHVDAFPIVVDLDDDVVAFIVSLEGK